MSKQMPASSKEEALYIVFLAMIAAVPAMATDMYLAAMPTIASQWQVPESRVGLSLVLWFVAFSLFLLVCGPLSDRHGRRPVLLAGLTLFVLATFACALAQDVWQLIGFRILQGIGAAGPSSMALAICRDRYDGLRRKRALAYIGIILTVVPAVAPTLGAWLLAWFNWRFIFLTQGMLGIVALLVALRFRETAAERVAANLLGLLGRYRRVIENRRYLLTNMAMGLILGPFYGFIAFSSIVYIQIFGLSERAFGLLFGINALMSMAGAFTCTRVIRYLSDSVLLSVCLVGCTLAGGGILMAGHWHYLAFAGFMCAITFFCGMSRPLSNHLILQQVDRDIGSASSFIVFYQFLVGAVCMRIVTTDWSDPIFVFGLVALLLPASVLAIWPLLLRMLNEPVPTTVGS
ncbi:MAG: multidrug effflux MFS transporter [Sedimentisphaerales bacterium]|jgi:DHA1 family bicyclomycin/chloramphenicol resistance-like MFS transporter|nr:multidrug effflux MFS transporter [Sedimentisphaerales bacterium]HNY76929.1 multidrug effflux MFS transporter [Sedimentisphaerales bacterium]HOC62783.1 multidrug effflux MFS transporter [Sedimentisphaerales bacterium]HOH62703.1 multidrug effflux MFS transporter [Sedimentisphaerales bacterium]HPY49647.1 multidrug effflux MFS transporter [Sedimentisphaerales bacterium]